MPYLTKYILEAEAADLEDESMEAPWISGWRAGVQDLRGLRSFGVQLV